MVKNALLEALASGAAYMVRGLFIDRDAAYRARVGKLVEGKIDLTEVDSFEDAVKRLQSGLEVDFVLVDWECVEKNGLVALDDLRRMTRKPIVILSGKDLEPSELYDAMESGVVAYVYKREIEEIEKQRTYAKSPESCPPRLALQLIDAATKDAKKDVETSLINFDAAISKLREK